MNDQSLLFILHLTLIQVIDDTYCSKSPFCCTACPPCLAPKAILDSYRVLAACMVNLSIPLWLKSVQHFYHGPKFISDSEQQEAPLQAGDEGLSDELLEALGV